MYYQRAIEHKLISMMMDPMFMLLTGARQTGKTTLMRRCQDYCHDEGLSTVWISLENPSYLSLLNQHPDKLWDLVGAATAGRLYVFIDEIQYLDDPSTFLKYHYDMHRDRIKIIATGSSSFWIDTKFHDSLVGRCMIDTIYPLSFVEYLVFVGVKVDLLSQAQQGSRIAIDQCMIHYHDYIKYGGYPQCVLADGHQAKLRYLSDLANRYVTKDIADAGIEQHDKYMMIMKILSNNIGQLVNKSEIANTLDMKAQTVDSYLYVMQKSFHIQLIKPFYQNNIRKEFTKMPKVYFLDTGLRNRLINNFESWDLRLDSGALCENVYMRSCLDVGLRPDDIRYRRTQQKQELDFVIQGSRAYEIKKNKSKFSPQSYASFTTLYPNIPLLPLDLEDIMIGTSH